MITKREFLFATLACLALSPSAGAASNIEDAAADACDCLKEPYAKMAELRAAVAQAMASGDTSRLMNMQGDMEALGADTEICFNKLEKKYPDIAASEALQDKAQAEMERQCPRPELGFGPPQ